MQKTEQQIFVEDLIEKYIKPLNERLHELEKLNRFRLQSSANIEDERLVKLLMAIKTHKEGNCSHFGVECGGGISTVVCAVCDKTLQAIG